jgi:excisionase family DNA binding protein
VATIYAISSRNTGEVDDIVIFRNQRTGDSLGYGFVKFARHLDALEAIKKLNKNKKRWRGGRLKVSVARPREERIFLVHETGEGGAMDKLLSVSELAKILGIAPGTLYHWLSQKRLPCVRFSSRCVRFRKSDVENWLEEIGADRFPKQDS